MVLRYLCPWMVLLLFGHVGLGQDTGAEIPASSSSRNLRSDVLRLLEAEGMKDMLETAVKQSVATAKTSIVEACPRCTSQFHNEFAKRFAARLRVEDLMNLFASVYEKSYTRSEVVQLVVMNEKRKIDVSYAISQELQGKVDSVKVTLLSEGQKKITDHSGKLGVDIFREIEKEHPDWVKQK